MAVWRMTSVLQSVSGLPADQVTNTWHFRAIAGDTGDDIGVQVLALQVVQFWIGEVVGGGVGMAPDLAKSVADAGHQVRCYLYDEVTGDRVAGQDAPPEFVSPFDFDTVERGSEALGHPQEVALKVSLRNTVEVNVPLARRTGGVYFGPIENLNFLEGDGDINQPPTALRTRLLDAMETLVEAGDGNGRRMVVWSRPFAGRAEVLRPPRPPLPAIPARDGELFDVTQVFVDDEWDTQRRRGRKAGARTFRVPTLAP